MTLPTVLHQTDDWMVIDKPAGMHSVARGDDVTNTVQGWLADHDPAQSGLRESGLVHRLDLGTSGCLLAARTEEVRESLWNRMRGDAIRKRYIALVDGSIPPEGSFDLYFTSRYKRSKKITARQQGDPRDLGRCSWWTVDRAGSRCLLGVELIGGGRRHQIRAGFAYLGVPLLGDELYGGDSWSEDRPALHAAGLRVDDQDVESPLPFGLHS